MNLDAMIEDAILRLAAGYGPGSSVSPTEVARVVGEASGQDWHTLLRPVRNAAVRLANEGSLLILRKGRPVDPNYFRGVYRLAIADSCDEPEDGIEEADEPYQPYPTAAPVLAIEEPLATSTPGTWVDADPDGYAPLRPGTMNDIASQLENYLAPSFYNAAESESDLVEDDVRLNLHEQA